MLQAIYPGMERRPPPPTVTPSSDVELADDGSRYSKAMAKLLPAHRRFVDALFNLQERDFSTAYVLAYGKVDPTDPKDREVARVSGLRIAHRDDVREAIFSESARRMTAYVPMIVEMLVSIATDSTHKDAARVGLGILDRTGHGPSSTVNTNISGDIQQTTSLKIDVTDPRTAVAVRKFADALNLNGDDFAKYLGTELAKRAGLPAAPALPTTDAEFEEVSSADVAEFTFEAS